MRFREFAIAFKGDAKNMFLKLKIREADRDAQRFFWRDNSRNTPPDEDVMSTVLFGAKFSPCTDLHIKNENAARFSSKYPFAVTS